MAGDNAEVTDKITDKITDKLSETIVFSIITRHFKNRVIGRNLTERLAKRKKPTDFGRQNGKGR